MNTKKVVKFNYYMSCTLLAILFSMFLAATIAYFTATKKATATFTSGNVEIVLSESGVSPDDSGNLVKDPNKPMLFGEVEDVVVHDCGRVYPGTTIYKDPTITNTGDAEEWIAAKVTITDGAGDLHKIMGYTDYAEIDIERLIAGGLLDEEVEVEDWNGIADVCVNERYAMIQVADNVEGKYDFYFLMLEPVDVGKSVTIFEQVVFDQMWTNEHMKELADLKIHVQAYGVQTFQMESCLQAMTLAFPEHFPFDTDIK